jgi:uncharacterized BrkB/YihY/UPF0761 family membrane protein
MQTIRSLNLCHLFAWAISNTPLAGSWNRSGGMQAWKLVKGSILGFISDGALSQGAAIAHYTVFGLAPVLIVVIAIAGLGSATKPLAERSSRN